MCVEFKMRRVDLYYFLIYMTQENVRWYLTILTIDKFEAVNIQSVQQM